MNSFVSIGVERSVLFLFQINKRGESVDDKIKKLDVELSRYKEQIKKTRPGPAQEAVKARAMRVLKQKRMYIPLLPPSLFATFLKIRLCYLWISFNQKVVWLGDLAEACMLRCSNFKAHIFT